MVVASGDGSEFVDVSGLFRIAKQPEGFFTGEQVVHGESFGGQSPQEFVGFVFHADPSRDFVGETVADLDLDVGIGLSVQDFLQLFDGNFPIAAFDVVLGDVEGFSQGFGVFVPDASNGAKLSIGRAGSFLGLWLAWERLAGFDGAYLR